MEFPDNVKSILANLHDGFFVVDRNRRITYWNKAAENITGYSEAEILGSRSLDDLLVHIDAAGNQLRDTNCPLAKAMNQGLSSEAEVYLHHKNGHRVGVLIRVAPLHDTDGEIVGGTELFVANTSPSALQEELEELRKLALLDPLTRLPNRRHFTTQVQACFAHLHRNGMPFGLLFIDIDDFKQLSAEYGHDVGNLTLQTVAGTLRQSVRPFDTVARWGGEEFVGVFPNVDADGQQIVAERIRSLVSKTEVKTAKETLQLTVSIGGATARKGDSIASLMKRADTMVLESRKKGNDHISLAKE